MSSGDNSVDLVDDNHSEKRFSDVAIEGDGEGVVDHGDSNGERVAGSEGVSRECSSASGVFPFSFFKSDFDCFFCFFNIMFVMMIC